MKKFLGVFLALLMVVSALSACSKTQEVASSSTPAATANPTAAPTEAAGADATAVPSAEVKIMKIAGTMSQAETDGEYNGTLKFAELVEKYTNGSIQVEVYPSSQLGSFSEFIEGVMMGSVEACVCGASGLGTSDSFLYFLEMPYLFENLQHARNLWETDNEAKAQIAEHLAALNIISAGTLYRSPRVWCNNLRAVTSTADNKSIKMRTPESEISIALVTAMGANPVTVSWSEVYTALSTGTVDGVENTITELYNNNLQETVKYCSETSHMLNTQNILVSKSWFDALTVEEQDAIMKAGAEATAWRAEQLQSEVDNAWKQFEAAGVEVIYQDDLDLTSFREAGQTVVDTYIEKGYFTQEFIDLIKGLASQ